MEYEPPQYSRVRPRNQPEHSAQLADSLELVLRACIFRVLKHSHPV